MGKVGQVLDSLHRIEAKITAERNNGTSRNKVVIKKLQREYQEVTVKLSRLHKADRQTPLDKNDKSGEEFKKEKEKIHEENKKKAAQKRAEIDAKSKQVN